MLLSYRELVELLGFLTLSVLYYKSNTTFSGMHLFLASRGSDPTFQLRKETDPVSGTFFFI